MRVLLDECVDRRLAESISGHDAFVTVDRNLPFQQDLSRLSLIVIVLRARSNRLTDLQALIPQLLSALPNAKPGKVTWVDS